MSTEPDDAITDYFPPELRLPACGSPVPRGILDPATPGLLDGARQLLGQILERFFTPAWLATWPGVFQWTKFEFLDWLRPLELLVRRILLIEAISLILSQNLPAARKVERGQARSAARARRPRPDLTPDDPGGWRVSFSILPAHGPSGPRHVLPAVDDLYLLGAPRSPGRFRRRLHDPMPLARRLEAVLRVVVDPAAFARRLAFRLRRGAIALIDRLVRPPRRTPKIHPMPATQAVALRRGGELLADLLDSS